MCPGLQRVWRKARLLPHPPGACRGLRAVIPGFPGAAWMGFTFGDDAPGLAGPLQERAASALPGPTSDMAAWGQVTVAVVIGPSETRVRAQCVARAVCQESGLGLWLGSRLRSLRQ